MATNNSSLPEGTDTIITGASADEADDALSAEFEDAGGDAADDDDAPSAAAGSASQESGGTTGPSGGAESLRDAAAGKAGDLKSQATDKAREYALQGKDRATEALDNIARLVGDAADSVEEKLGPQYSGYARRAAEAVTGVADNLRDKDVDELFDQARELVRQSPAIAIGAAAAVGFALARLAKAAVPDPAQAAAGAENDVVFEPDAKA
jgi:ElaB/YqjD/DUF883 family membrane-anchored ribosome-binding protein